VRFSNATSYIKSLETEKVDQLTIIMMTVDFGIPLRVARFLSEFPAFGCEFDKAARCPLVVLE